MSGRCLTLTKGCILYIYLCRIYIMRNRMYRSATVGLCQSGRLLPRYGSRVEYELYST